LITRILHRNLTLGLVIHTVSWGLLLLDVSFMKTWFYIFAWWSFILVLDGINLRRTGTSPMADSFRLFVFSAFISVFVWLLFELFNLRLHNWSYHSLPKHIPLRWSGYSLAFATVIPALTELAFFFRRVIGKKKRSFLKISPSKRLHTFSFLIGLLCLLGPLIWPRIFFPCVWLCFIFLLEPVNHKLGLKTLLSDMAENDWTNIWSWLLAGLTSGFLWEFWNYFSRSHWEYHLPYLDFWRVFQMPVFGYLGFLPFSLEVFVLLQTLVFLRGKMRSRPFKIIAVLALVAFCLATYGLMDRFTLIAK